MTRRAVLLALAVLLGLAPPHRAAGELRAEAYAGRETHRTADSRRDSYYLLAYTRHRLTRYDQAVSLAERLPDPWRVRARALISTIHFTATAHRLPHLARHCERELRRRRRKFG